MKLCLSPRILVLFLVLFLSANPEVWSSGKEIVLENDWYYVLHPDGKKVSIGPYRTAGEPRAEAIFSPDSSWVAYTRDNGTGWEGQGRDLCYCRVDGTERTTIVSTDASIRYVHWVNTQQKNYILFIQWATGFEGIGHVKVYDLGKKRLAFDSLGTSLVRIGESGRFLVSDYLFSWKTVYILELGGDVPTTLGLDDLRPTDSELEGLPCAAAQLQDSRPDLRVAPVGFIPGYWPHDHLGKLKYIDLVRRSFEFTRLSCLVPSPDRRFLAFSATGDRFACNGLLDTKRQRTYALRFILGTFDGEPCWSPNSQYVAFINLVGDRNKFINVFAIDSVLRFRDPMIIKRSFERPTDKSFRLCFSSDSDTIYYEASGWGKPESGKLSVRR
jgi:hypothetical protein